MPDLRNPTVVAAENASAAAYYAGLAAEAATTTRRTAKYSGGKLIGYLVEVLDSKGKLISSNFEPSEAEDVKTLAEDTFVNTFSLIVGTAEGGKAYVRELYKYVSNFYKKGSSIEEATNLALRAARKDNAIPEFTNRFKAIFALEDMKTAGKIVDVPTIAEYVKSEETMAEVLRRANLADLATQDFLSTVLSTGKSVAESAEIITDVFTMIDNAPQAVKDNIAKALPYADRATLAKAILSGPQGVADLTKQANRIGVQTAAEMQGLSLTDTQAGELVARNQTFTSALPKFQQAAAILKPAQKLTEMEKGYMPDQTYTQAQAISATFDTNYAELQKLEELSKREQARFQAKAGTIGSKSLASQVRGMQ